MSGARNATGAGMNLHRFEWIVSGDGSVPVLTRENSANDAIRAARQMTGRAFSSPRAELIRKPLVQERQPNLFAGLGMELPL